MKRTPAGRGFTLIELMIAMAVVGILTTVAYPAYREQVATSRRAQVKARLLSAQQWMERFHSANFRYDKNSAGTAVTDPSQFPSRFRVSPPPGEGAALYSISVVVTDGVRDAYSITATRKPGSAMASDRCGDFSLDHLGRKDLANYFGFGSRAAAIETCWK